MKNHLILLLILFLTSSSFVFCQTDTLTKKELKKIAREEKKEMAAAEAALAFKRTRAMVEHRRFVLEADMLYDTKGNKYSAIKDLNYVLVDSLYGVIQTGNTYSTAGNSLGGATREGRVKNYSFKLNPKRNSFTIKYDFSQLNSSSTITMIVSESGYASARVRDNILDNVIRFEGKLVPLAETTVYRRDWNYLD